MRADIGHTPVDVVTMPNALKPLAAVGLAVVIARLFMRGHAACHGRLFANRRANQIVGRLLFLPSYTPYRSWDLAHNRTHHAFTRFRGLDYMWRPLSLAKFYAAPRWRQALERLYRTIPGHGLSYFVAIYCRRLVVPSSRFVPERRTLYWWDSVAVGAFTALQVGFYVTGAIVARHSIVWVLFAALALPFALWNVLIGSTSFVYHTRPEIAWFDDLDEWHAVKPRLLDTGRVSPGVFLDAVRRCKLYDYRAHRWLDFDGRITAEIPLPGR